MTTGSDLIHRVRIDRRVKGSNSRGEVTYTYQPLVTIWAQANPLRGRDFFAAAQAQSEVTTRFRIRYRTGLDSTMRVVWRGAFYDIVGLPIEVDGARKWLDLMTRTGPQDGR